MQKKKKIVHQEFWPLNGLWPSNLGDKDHPKVKNLGTPLAANKDVFILNRFSLYMNKIYISL